MITELVHRASGECLAMVRFVVRVTTDPTRRFMLFWNAVGWGLSALYMIIGAGYAVGGTQATSSQSLQLLINIEGGNPHVHGYLMMGLALFLSHGLGRFYTRSMRLALRLTVFYSLATAFLIIGGWAIYDVEFAAPWWYLFAAFLAIVLQAFAPVPLPRDPYVRVLQRSGRA